ncbi:hypothetical protein IWQ62_004407, partial [Dispira parvispora]
LRLRTIISIIPSDPTSWLVKYTADHHITHHVFQANVPKDNVTLTSAIAKACLEMWSLSAAINEYIRFLKTPEFTDEDEEFFEKFQEDIVIPPLIPHFLWGTPLPPSPSMSPAISPSPSPRELTCPFLHDAFLAGLSPRAGSPDGSGESAELDNQSLAHHGRYFCLYCHDPPFTKHPSLNLVFPCRRAQSPSPL